MIENKSAAIMAEITKAVIGKNAIIIHPKTFASIFV